MLSGLNYIWSKTEIKTVSTETKVVKPTAVEDADKWPAASDYTVALTPTGTKPATSTPTPKSTLAATPIHPAPTPTPAPTTIPVKVSVKPIPKTVEKAPNKPKIESLVKVDTILWKGAKLPLKAVKGVYVTFTGKYEKGATARYIVADKTTWNYVVDATNVRQMIPDYHQATSGSTWARTNCVSVALAQHQGIAEKDRDILAAKMCAQLLTKYKMSTDKLYLDPNETAFSPQNWTLFKFLVNNYMK